MLHGQKSTLTWKNENCHISALLTAHFCHIKSLIFVFSSIATHIRKGSCGLRIFTFGFSATFEGHFIVYCVFGCVCGIFAPKYLNSIKFLRFGNYSIRMDTWNLKKCISWTVSVSVERYDGCYALKKMPIRGPSGFFFPRGWYRSNDSYPLVLYRKKKTTEKEGRVFFFLSAL